MHYALLSKSNKLAGGRWGFPLKPQKAPFFGRNEFDWEKIRSSHNEKQKSWKVLPTYQGSFLKKKKTTKGK